MRPLGPSATRLQLRQQLLLHARTAERDGMFSPSIVARQVAGAQWHALMPAVHRAARELIEEGVLEGWHLGRPLYPGESLHGPLRLKLRGPALTARHWRIEVMEGTADGRGKSGRTERKLR